jgi:hypothetical protein
MAGRFCGSPGMHDGGRQGHRLVVGTVLLDLLLR